MKKETDRKLSIAAANATPAETSGGGIGDTSPFVRIEKNLIAMGFFTPTRPGLKNTRVKTVKYTSKDDEGQEVTTSIRINTGGNYGLPGTADLDKFLALQKLINNIQKKSGGVVTNPISFSSWELLAVLGLRKKTGRNYELVEEWLDRMCATTIEAVGDSFVAGQRRFGKDRITVFRRGTTFGNELEKGVIADRNYVWLEDWLLDSINDHFLVSIDFDTYRLLDNSIAKTLVPLLQIWLYASRGGAFEKSYEDFCQFLGITECKHESKIKERLAPSLDELIKHGYLSEWKVEKQRGSKGYKLVLKHGEKFYRDLEDNRRRQEQLTGATDDGVRGGEDELVELLTQRGVAAHVARQLVADRAEGQFIEDQAEWFDELLRRRGAGSFTNPPGLLVTLIKTNVPIDPNFETRRMRRLREEYEARRAEREEAGATQAGSDLDLSPPSDDLPPRAPTEYDLFLLENKYREYKRQEVARHIRNMRPGDRAALKERARILYAERYRDAARVLKGQAADGIIEGIEEELMAPEVQVLSLADFIERQGNVTDAN